MVPTDFEETVYVQGKESLRENEGTGVGCSSYRNYCKGFGYKEEQLNGGVAGREIG